MMTHKNYNATDVDVLINKFPENESCNVNLKKHPKFPHSQNGNDLWNEIRNSVSEKDILALREKLQEISIQVNKEKTAIDAVFDLTEMLDIHRFLDQDSACLPDMMAFMEPLPKIHVHHHHRRATGETIHQLYMEQQNAVSDDAGFEDASDSDEEWNLIADAVSEKDIMELRDSLQHISAFNHHPGFSTQDIEMFLEGQMDDIGKKQFEDELMVNAELRADVELHKELEKAVSEKEIIALRDSLDSIAARQISTSKSLTEIETFLEDELSDTGRTAFLDELSDNDDLKAEVRFMKELNSAVSESDVMILRENLKKISTEVYTQEKKSFLPIRDRSKNVRKAVTVAAIFFLLTALSFLVQYTGESQKEVFAKYSQLPQAISTFRSAEVSANADIENAFRYYNEADYKTALVFFGKILEKEASLQFARFYSGASYQGLCSYEKAISEYDQVIVDNDNMFVDQAEWYRALCNVRLGNREVAFSQLEAISNKKGFFTKDAKLLLKHVKGINN